MFTYNINNNIKVKLTERGKAILENEVADTMNMLENLKLPPFSDNYFPYPEDANGYTEFQLWDFIKIFGNYFYVGCPLIIEENEIIFIDGEDRLI